MSLQIETTYKGIVIPKAVAKITHVSIIETSDTLEWKLYKCFVQVNTYTDSTKEFDINQHTYEFDKITEAQFTLTACYEWLKTLPEFLWALDI